MKKTISILICVILATTIFTACASAPAPASSPMRTSNDAAVYMAPEAPQAAPMPPAPEAVMADMEMGYYEDSGATYGGGSQAAGDGIMPITAPATEGLAEKIIYSVSAEIETRNFDETIHNVNALLFAHGAFIETSSVSGVSNASRLHGWVDYRYALFILRVPVQQLNAITADLDSLGNVVHRSVNADNITSQFFDTQSRLNTLSIQEERLLDMLRRAEDVPDLIAIEQRLGEVRYQIESLTTTLNNWQNQVDYSYLTLNIREVEQFTEPTDSYWRQIGDGFMSTIRGVGRFFMNLFMWLIISAPVLVILAVIAVAALIIIKRKLRSIKSKKEKAPAPAVGPNAPKYTPPEYHNWQDK